MDDSKHTQITTILTAIGVLIAALGLLYVIDDHMHPQTPIPTPTPTLPNTGNISVISSPKGASVYLDNMYYGITPTILNNVEQGSHIITFKLAGYEDWSQGIVVKPNNPVSISPKLTPTEILTPTPTENLTPTPNTAYAAPFAYITNSGNNSVSVIDTATDTVVSTVPVGKDPNGVAVSPDGSKIYVANMGNNNLSVIDTATNTVTATVKVGKSPYGIAVSPDGSKVYVASCDSNSISVIDTATNKVIGTVKVGSDPARVAVNPDGSKVYVANCDSDSVSVINTATNKVIGTVNVEMMPFGVAVTPDGTKVYVANMGAASVSVIDTATNTVKATVGNVGSNPKGVAVNPDGSKVYVINELGKDVAVIDTATNKVTATVPVGTVKTGAGLVDEWFDGISVTPDGTKVYVVKDSINEGGTVSVIDTATKKVIGTVKVGSNPVGIGVTPTR